MVLGRVRSTNIPVLLGLRLSCPIRSYGAPLVPQQEQTPGAASDEGRRRDRQKGRKEEERAGTEKETGEENGWESCRSSFLNSRTCLSCNHPPPSSVPLPSVQLYNSSGADLQTASRAVSRYYRCLVKRNAQAEELVQVLVSNFFHLHACT